MRRRDNKKNNGLQKRKSAGIAKEEENRHVTSCNGCQNKD